MVCNHLNGKEIVFHDNSGDLGKLSALKLTAILQRKLEICGRLKRPKTGEVMEELTRSTDPIRLSFLTHLLAEAGIESVILDQHTSQMFFGSLQGLEQRLMVASDDLAQARRLIRDVEAVLATEPSLTANAIE